MELQSGSAQFWSKSSIFLAVVWSWNLKDDVKKNSVPLISNINLCASFHHHMWIQTGVTIRKRLSWLLNSVKLTFNLWPFVWTSNLPLVITPENSMMISLWGHSEKSVTDGRTDWTIRRAAWSQLKKEKIRGGGGGGGSWIEISYDILAFQIYLIKSIIILILYQWFLEEL